MNDEERYLFDLRGYLLLPGVLSKLEIEELNTLIDEQELPEPGETLESQRFNHFLPWGRPFCNLLDHSHVLPYLKDLVDPCLRLDRYYGIYMRSGTSGLPLHSGATPHEREEYFHYHNGSMYNGITTVMWALTGVPYRQGGFVCIPGSHKANYPRPEQYDYTAECVVQVIMQAGDVLIFTSALAHGTHPWSAPFYRRALLFKYAPGHMAWGRGYLNWSAGLKNLLTPQQRQLLEPPYGHRREEIGSDPGSAWKPSWEETAGTD